MKTLLTSLILTLALSVNAYAFQIADGQYQSNTKYNNVRLSDYQDDFNSVTAKTNSGVELGAIIAVPSYAISKYTPENGWLPCDGEASMDGTELCTQNSAMCGKTPDLNGKGLFLQGTNEASKTVEAGIPNIKGRFYHDINATYYLDGPFSWTRTGKVNLANSENHSSGYVTFDPSRVSSVYRDTHEDGTKFDTVQPPAYTVRYFIKVNE